MKDIVLLICCISPTFFTTECRNTLELQSIALRLMHEKNMFIIFRNSDTLEIHRRWLNFFTCESYSYNFSWVKYDSVTIEGIQSVLIAIYLDLAALRNRSGSYTYTYRTKMFAHIHKPNLFCQKCLHKVLFSLIISFQGMFLAFLSTLRQFMHREWFAVICFNFFVTFIPRIETGCPAIANIVFLVEPASRSQRTVQKKIIEEVAETC